MKPWRLFWVLALAAAGPLEGQATGQITGTVRNKEGQPTASASVMVRGTRISGVTGPDGRYTLAEVPPGSYTVVAALIGYGFATATATVTAGQATQLDFSLEVRAVQLEGITVVGYGTQEKRTVTGAVSTITADKLVETPTSNAIKPLQDRLPAADLTNPRPTPRAAPEVNNIVPSDVLKHPASTSIYGSRGANGVMLVTTKGSGTGGVQTESRAGMSYAGQSAYGLPTLMNNDQYVKALQDAAAYAGSSTNPQNLLNNVAYAAYQAGQHTDWQKLIGQTGYQKTVQMGMSGISSNTRFNLSGNYFDQTGTAVGLEFSRGTGTASVDHTQ